MFELKSHTSKALLSRPKVNHRVPSLCKSDWAEHTVLLMFFTCYQDFMWQYVILVKLANKLSIWINFFVYIIGWFFYHHFVSSWKCNYFWHFSITTLVYRVNVTLTYYFWTAVMIFFLKFRLHKPMLNIKFYYLFKK